MPRHQKVSRQLSTSSSLSSSTSSSDSFEDRNPPKPRSTSTIPLMKIPYRRPSQGGKAPRSFFTNPPQLETVVSTSQPGTSTAEPQETPRRSRRSASSTGATTLSEQKPKSQKTTKRKTRQGRKAPQLQATGEAAGPSGEQQNETTRAAQAAFERVKKVEEELLRELEDDEAFQAVRSLSWQK